MCMRNCMKVLYECKNFSVNKLHNTVLLLRLALKNLVFFFTCLAYQKISIPCEPFTMIIVRQNEKKNTYKQIKQYISKTLHMYRLCIYFKLRRFFFFNSTMNKTLHTLLNLRRSLTNLHMNRLCTSLNPKRFFFERHI